MNTEWTKKKMMNEIDAGGLLELATRHGNLEGNDAEIGDLQDMVRELWDLLAPASRSKAGAVILERFAAVDIHVGDQDPDDE